MKEHNTPTKFNNVFIFITSFNKLVSNPKRNQAHKMTRCAHTTSLIEDCDKVK